MQIYCKSTKIKLKNNCAGLLYHIDNSNEAFVKILVTGAAGFIGHQLSVRLCKLGHDVVGLDNINDYYDVNLKKDRLKELEQFNNFKFVLGDLADNTLIIDLFKAEKFTHVVNLAAQAGVRYSLENPMAYVQSNLVGFAHLLEACRHNNVEHFVFASSSSIYGLNSTRPYSEQHNVDHPVSLYAASKKSNELMAHSYSHLYNIPCTGLRFFTVYGPWSRPDMALHLFTTAIINDKPIKIFNNGEMQRDFTYIDDIVEGVVQVLNKPPKKNADWDTHKADAASSSAPWKIYNIGNNNTIALGKFIELLEKHLGKKAIKEYLPMQAGDVQSTHADVSALMRDTGFSPNTSLDEGLAKFVAWYKDYYNINT